MTFSIMVPSGYVPSSETVGSYGSFISNFLGNLHTVLYSGYINLHWSTCVFFHSWFLQGICLEVVLLGRMVPLVGAISYLISDYATKLKSSRQYGTGTRTEV